MKRTDPYYRTPEWQSLRGKALHRDKHTCTTPGCGQRAVVVDHTGRRTKLL